MTCLSWFYHFLEPVTHLRYANFTKMRGLFLIVEKNIQSPALRPKREQLVYMKINKHRSSVTIGCFEKPKINQKLGQDKIPERCNILVCLNTQLKQKQQRCKNKNKSTGKQREIKLHRQS